MDDALCGVCCIACTESFQTWCDITRCCPGSDTRIREAGCCNTCCKKSFDEDDFFAEEKRRDRAAASGVAINTQPSPGPSMSPTPENKIGNGNAENRAADTSSTSAAEDRTTEAPRGYDVGGAVVSESPGETTSTPSGQQ